MNRICLISILIGFAIISAFPQDSIVSIPDTIFMRSLMHQGVDLNGDSLISYSEAEAITNLQIGAPTVNGISDPTGIESFVNLDTLIISFWDGETRYRLDLSRNTKLMSLTIGTTAPWGFRLTELNLENNSVPVDVTIWGINDSVPLSQIPTLQQLSAHSAGDSFTLTLSNTPELLYLECTGVSNLDISDNAKLIGLKCNRSNLENLDLTRNLNLRYLKCSENQFSELNLTNNRLLGQAIESTFPLIGEWDTIIELSEMPVLESVCLWRDADLGSLSFDTTGSPNISITTDCRSNETVEIPDTAFLYALIEEGIDINEDSLISYGEALLINSLDVSRLDITSLVGIEAFINLDTLECSENLIEALDLRSNSQLKYLVCDHNQLDRLDISGNQMLETLSCVDNKLTQLDVSNNPLLASVKCYGTQINELDFEHCIRLRELRCGNSGLTKLSLNGCKMLEKLQFGFYGVGEGDQGWYNDDIKSFELRDFPELESFKCVSAGIEQLIIENTPKLNYLDCAENKLRNLDLQHTGLRKVICFNNLFTNLIIPEDVNLQILNCGGELIKIY